MKFYLFTFRRGAIFKLISNYGRNPNLTVYVDKQKTLSMQPLKESKENFVVTEFVKHVMSSL